MVGPLPTVFKDAGTVPVTYCIQCDTRIGGIARPGMICSLNPNMLVDYIETMKTMSDLYDPVDFLVRGLRIFK